MPLGGLAKAHGKGAWQRRMAKAHGKGAWQRHVAKARGDTTVTEEMVPSKKVYYK